MSPEGAPLIVTALFGEADFAWLDGLRRDHFLPERNQLSAHLTLFHHLPPSVEPEARQRLAEAVRRPAPPATAAGILNLGKGTAIRVDAPELVAIRRDLADAFAGLLTPQDASGFRPHVTIQNKVTPEAARALREMMAATFDPRPLAIAGLALWRYLGGPWQAASRHHFR